MRAAGGLDGRASPFLKASGEGCEWGFFKWSEDRMGGRNDAGFRLLVWVAHCGLMLIPRMCPGGPFSGS